MNEEAEAFVDALRDADVGRIRRAIAYDGEAYDHLYTRDDVADAQTPEEIEETTKNLILKGFDDELDQPEFSRFGHLDLSVRWFHEVVVLQVPLGQWSGVIVSFDRDSVVDTGAFTDIALDYIENPASELRESEGEPEGEELDDAVEEQFS
ncbi:hypothetical protein [Halarchaeum nitratireducens]|uniref:Uncharacterized protein n=1 Tax=Halarchaeum nitratireducens TaxID=489913 RepID=A0A830GCH6_9EURY|nr:MULTISPECIES: hypothetical protein [Halarchaeum]MBP2250884.1 hypothetical protein [Halarchaeum solikamskense]GGN19629.1 hypothetical protein GCM10009021_20920 [Halarchaeum nitratireducens]